MPPFVDDDTSLDVCSTVNVVGGVMTHDDFLDWSNQNQRFMDFLHRGPLFEFSGDAEDDDSLPSLLLHAVSSSSSDNSLPDLAESSSPGLVIERIQTVDDPVRAFNDAISRERLISRPIQSIDDWLVGLTETSTRVEVDTPNVSVAVGIANTLAIRVHRHILSDVRRRVDLDLSSDTTKSIDNEDKMEMVD